MNKIDGLTKGLAVVGTTLVWFPVLAPVLLAVISWIVDGRFRFDYLMPGELFLLVLVGGVLLVWAALRAHARQKLIGWSLGGAVVLLVGSQALAVVTGLASGAIEPTGLWWTLVIILFAAYVLALIALGVGGALLLGDLLRPPRTSTAQT